MSYNDMIRRGDVREILFDEGWHGNTLSRVDALPAADAAEAKLAEVQLIAGVALHTQKQLEADLTAATARADAAEAKLKAILEADAQIWAADAADMVRLIPKEGA